MAVLRIIGRLLASLLLAGVLVLGLVSVSFALTPRPASPRNSKPSAIKIDLSWVGPGILETLLLPQSLFRSWDVPPPEGTSGGPMRSELMALWFFDVPVFAAGIFVVLTVRARRRAAGPRDAQG